MSVLIGGLMERSSRLGFAASVYIPVQQAANRTHGPVVPFLMAGTLLGVVLILLTQWKHRDAGFWLTAVAAVSFLVIILSTVSQNVAINSTIDTWNSAAPPSDWSDVRLHWENLHLFRTVVASVGWLSLLCALIWRPDPQMLI